MADSGKAPLVAEDLEQILWNAFQSKQIGKFERTLKDVEDIRVIENTGLFEKICQTPDSEPFIKTCLDAKYDPAKINQIYSKFPIHFAAESLDAKHLKVLLQFNPNLISQTDSNNCTPLHIVIEALTNENFEQIYKVIKVLIEYNADINLSLTPLKLDTPFNRLLEKLESITDIKRKKILDFIDDHVMYIDISMSKDSKNSLKTYYPQLLERLTTESYMGQTTKQVEAKLIDHMDVKEKKMIQDLYTLYGDAKLTNVAREILNGGLLLEEAIKKGNVVSVKMLIKLGADPFKTYDKREPAISVACYYGNPNIVKLILDSRKKFDCKGYPRPLLHHIIINFKKKGHFQPETDHYKTFEMMINNPNIDVNELDKSGQPALYYAVGRNDKVSIRKLLRKNAFIGTLSTANVGLPFKNIDPELLEQYFDTCITPKDKNQNPGDDGYELIFNFTSLKPPVDHKATINELTAIKHIATTKKFQHLIQHPLVMGFLFLKWFPLSPLFYINLVICAVNCAIVVAYIVILYGHNNPYQQYFVWIPMGFSLLILLRELAQFVFAPKRYFRSIENYIELVLVLLTWLVCCDDKCIENDEIRRTVGGLAILLSVLELTSLVGALPIFSLSTHMNMLKKVTKTFLQVFALYSVILGAFAFCFYTLLGLYGKRLNSSKSEADEFSLFKSPGAALVKTIVMLTGEFDAGSIEFKDNYFSYIVFVVFVFFISVVMMNLLSGLAVSDTQVIKSQVALHDWIERAKFLATHEQSFVAKEIFKNLIPIVLNNNIITVKVNNYASSNLSIPIIVQKMPSNMPDEKQSQSQDSSGKVAMQKIWKNLLIFDYKIVKSAISVMESCAAREASKKESNNEKKRIESIEKNVNEILCLLKKEGSVAQTKETGKAGTRKS